MADLEQLRKEIDEIDDRLIKELLERFKVCGSVAEEKAKTNGQITDGKREAEILYRITENVPDKLKMYVKELYVTLFATSKAYQSAIIKKSSPTVEVLNKLIEEGVKEMPVRAAVACQGVEGAYSESAAEKFFPISDVTFFKSFDGVFSAVERGLCDYGVLPIENSTFGSVSEVYDLMKKHRFYIVRAAKLKIEHCLAALPLAEERAIKKVYSHPQALGQCSEYILSHKLEKEECANTAMAAKNLSASGDTTAAVICSPRSAKRYGLKIIDRNVQNVADNYTRFICISKDPALIDGCDKISLMTALPHTAGSLNRLLMRFSCLGLNMTKIESRPIEGTDFEFMFYFDFEGDVKNKDVQSLIADLENGSDKFVFLGAYKETI